MCGSTFNMTEIEVTEGYGNFSNMAICHIMFSEFEKLPGNPNFSQISQAFPLTSLEFIKKVRNRLQINSTSSSNVQI